MSPEVLLKTIIWVVTLAGFCLIVPTYAQKPVVLPLNRVKSVYVLNQTKGEGFDQALADRLRRWGQFKLVTEASQDHDATLAASYGCDPFSFRFVEVSRKAGWTVCDIRLLDADLLGRGVTSAIWEMPIGVLQDLHAPPTTSEKIADGFVEQIRKDFEIASGLRKPDPVISLREIRTVYVAQGDVSDLEDAPFEKTIMASLVAKKKTSRVHSCDQGYDSVVPGVRLVCGVWQAEAILISLGAHAGGSRTRYEDRSQGTYSGGADAGTVKTRSGGAVWQEQFSTGSAALLDRHTLKVIWVTAKDDSAGWAAALVSKGAAGPGGTEKIADRIVKQLKGDREKATKNLQ